MSKFDEKAGQLWVEALRDRCEENDFSLNHAIYLMYLQLQSYMEGSDDGVFD